MGAFRRFHIFRFMPRVKLFKEEEVLTKAMNLFWKQGYAATSIQDLVQHLGINRGSIYDTFGDKEKLFQQAFEHYRKQNSEGVRLFLARHKEVKKGFQKLFERAITEALEDPDQKGCFVVNTTTELIPGDARILKILEENRRSFQALFLDYLKEGEKQGQFKETKDLTAIASLLFTFYNGLRVVSKVNPSKKELEQSVAQILLLLD